MEHQQRILQTDFERGAGMTPNYSADSGNNSIIVESRINEDRGSAEF